MVEGFTSAVANVFNSVLKVPSKSSFTQSKSVPGTSSGKTNPTSGTCVVAPNIPSTTLQASSNIRADTPSPFLKQMLINEKDTVESLLKAAAKIGPVVNTVMIKEAAADAAFVSKVPASIPTYGSTLQGFTFILLFWSLFSLAVVTSIYINQTTGNTASAGASFVGFAVIGVIIFSLIKRYG